MKLQAMYSSPHHYAVCRCDRAAGLVLYVLSGGIVTQAVVIELSPEEESAFERAGELDALARAVARSPSRFRDRTLRPLEPGETIEFVDAA